MDQLDHSYLTDLVKRARLGSGNAFAELFAATGQLHYAYLVAMMGDRDAARTALTECTVLIRRGLPGLQQPELFMPWACRLCFRHCAGTTDRSVPTPGGEYALSQVIQLPLAESQVLLMHYGQGFSLARTGELLNFSPRLTRRLLRGGLRRLRRAQPAGAGEMRVEAALTAAHGGRLPALDALQQASVLESVFQTCDLEENTVPLEALSSYAVYRKERFSLQRGVLAALLVLFFLLPALFLLPELELTGGAEGARGLPVFTLSVRSALPVRRVTAKVRTRSLPVYEDGAKAFSIEPTRNGDLAVTVELLNRQTATLTRKVSEVDAKSPELLASSIADATVTLAVADAGIGVDWRGIYAVNSAGTVLYPASTDASTGEVVFPFPQENWDVYIPDYIGNTLHLALTLQA